MPRIITLFASTFIALSPSQLLAHGDKPHTAQIYSSGTEALAGLQISIAAIEDIVSDAKYEDIHEANEHAETAAKALVDKLDVPADKKLRLEIAVKQLIAQLGKLHEAADKNDKAATELQMKKLKAAMKLVEVYSK